MDCRLTFERFKEEFEKHKHSVPKIGQGEFEILWMDDYYDGMLSGMLEYEHTKARFEIINDFNDGNQQRIFAIIQLNQRQINEEFFWNDLFRKYVGNHNDFRFEESTYESPKTHHLFYDQYKQRQVPDYRFNPVTAWFAQ
jgi:hypothetical protein